MSKTCVIRAIYISDILFCNNRTGTQSFFSLYVATFLFFHLPRFIPINQVSLRPNPVIKDSKRDKRLDSAYNVEYLYPAHSCPSEGNPANGCPERPAKSKTKPY